MANRGLGLLRGGIACLAAFLGILGILHVQNWAQFSDAHHMSNYVRLRDGWLWTIGLVTLGAGLALLAAGASRTMPAHRDATRAFRLMWSAAACVWLMAVFPTDGAHLPYTVGGWVHDLGAIFAVTLQGAAMLLFVDAGRNSSDWSAAGTSWTWPAVAVVLGFAWGTSDYVSYGAVSGTLQRLLAITMVGWMIGLGLRLAAVAQKSAPIHMATPVNE